MRVKKQLASVITILLFVGLCGCGGESCPTIEVIVESFYPFQVNGSFTVDGVFIENFTIDLFNATNFIVDKSILPNPDLQHHNVTMYFTSSGGTEVNETKSASCDVVTKEVKFVLSVSFKPSVQRCS